MKRVVTVENHQHLRDLSPVELEALEVLGSRAADHIAKHELLGDRVPLTTCEQIEVALVDDAESERVHVEFLGVSGPTDVITFDHGEIVVGIGVAARQAREHGEPEARELLRYVVHGLLHLAGHTDADPAARARMEAVQERLVAALWDARAQS